VSALDTFLDELAREFPRFRVVDKATSPLSRAIDVALRCLTLGGQRRYMTHYHTVIGDTLYVPACWAHTSDVDRVITLRHERVHLRQRRRYTLPGMIALYFLPFFPLGLAYGRARIEWEAYRETIRATLELRGAEAARSPHLREHVVRQFTSAAYGWMWPFRAQVERWYDEALRELGLEGAPEGCPEGSPSGSPKGPPSRPPNPSPAR
jgi:hypothetical protein